MTEGGSYMLAVPGRKLGINLIQRYKNDWQLKLFHDQNTYGIK